jgi:serine/threonine-protein kinase HipA
MNKGGRWELSPAFDVIYSHNPSGKWTNQHQMSMNGKRDHFTQNDLLAVGESISSPKPLDIVNQIQSAVERWSEFAREAGVTKKRILEIARYHRMNL